jgi:hypothetical protein
VRRWKIWHSSCWIKYSGCFIRWPDLIAHKILCSVEPRDLLALARTSTTFRAHLHSNASISVWRHVYQHMEDSYRAPEELPNWLDGPALTRLLFEPQCSVDRTPSYASTLPLIYKPVLRLIEAYSTWLSHLSSYREAKLQGMLRQSTVSTRRC